MSVPLSPETTMRHLPSLVLLLLSIAAPATAEIVETPVVYEHDGTTFEGFLAHDSAIDGPVPGVLIVHQWMGLSDNERMRARMLAEMGYVAFALDVYGQGVRPANTQEASEEAGKYYADRGLFRERVRLGLERLRAVEKVDDERVVAIGYCFGRTAVLELARSGADVAGVVSFHGGLETPDPSDAENVRTSILVCHGAVDPYVPMEQVAGFVDEMEAADVDYQLVMYAGAVHAFTQKGAGDDPAQGAAYDPMADRRSWEHMKGFFAEVLE